MSVFTSIGNFFKGVAAKVSAAFVKVFGKDAAQKFADGAVSLLKTAAGVIALDAVQAVENSNPFATPADKRNEAFKKIASDAKIQALGVGSSTINLLIELAVQTILKQSFVPKQ